MKSAHPLPAAPSRFAALLAAVPLALAMAAIFVVAPREATMGDAQRIVYLHVAVAWWGLAACLAMGITGGLYLLHRKLVWDHWSQAAAETGWLCTTLTLATGSLWAHEAWNTWWTWEPRLTTSLILWLIYAGYFLVRQGLDDPHRRATRSAILAILGMCDVPLVIMATRWFRGIHPVSPEMIPSMRAVLLLSTIGFTAMFVLLTVLRRRQLVLSGQIALWESRHGRQSYGVDG